MFPVDQQNLLLLSTTPTSSIEISGLSTDSGEFSGFENLFSAYVSTAEDENIAGFDSTALPPSDDVITQNQGQILLPQVLNATNLPILEELAPEVNTAFVSLQSNPTNTNSGLDINALIDQGQILESDVNVDTNSLLNTNLEQAAVESDQVIINRQTFQSTETATNINDLQNTIPSSINNSISQNANADTLNESSRSINNSLQTDVNATANQAVQQVSVNSNTAINNNLNNDEQINTPNNLSTVQSTTLLQNEPISSVNDLAEDANFVNQSNAANQINEELLRGIDQENSASLVSTPSNSPIPNSAVNSATVVNNVIANNLRQTNSVERVRATDAAIVIDNEASPAEIRRPLILTEEQNGLNFTARNDNAFSRSTAESISTSPLNNISLEVGLATNALSEDNLETSVSRATVFNAPQSTATINTQSTPAQLLAQTNQASLINNTATDLGSQLEITNTNEIAKQIAWAQQNGAQQIRLSITPEHLGAVDINIQESSEGINIQIVTQNIVAKESLEVFAPRLREMLEQSGVNIQDTSIEHQQKQNQDSSDTSYAQTNEQGESLPLTQQDTIENTNVSTNIVLSDHLLDAFA